MWLNDGVLVLLIRNVERDGGGFDAVLLIGWNV